MLDFRTEHWEGGKMNVVIPYQKGCLHRECMQRVVNRLHEDFSDEPSMSVVFFEGGVQVVFGRVYGSLKADLQSSLEGAFASRARPKRKRLTGVKLARLAAGLWGGRSWGG